MPRLHISLFGSPEVKLDSLPVKLTRQKSVALLAYLSTTQNSYQRDTLAALFWPEYPQSQAKTSLRMVIADLKKKVGGDFFIISRQSIQLNPKASVWVDCQEFDNTLSTPLVDHDLSNTVGNQDVNRLLTAVPLYTGKFMAGFALSDCPEFDTWQAQQAEKFESLYSRGLNQLINSYVQLDEIPRALQQAERWVKQTPWNEKAHQQLICLTFEAGYVSKALKLYDQYAEAMESELGVPPSAEMEALRSQILAKEEPKLSFANRQAAQTSQHSGSDEHRGDTQNDGIPNNLPKILTPFFGRESELAEIDDLINNPQCRILSLIGPGGAGKSRLSIEAMRPVIGSTDFADGVYFFPLVAINSASQIISKIGHIVGFNFYGNLDPKIQLINYLREKRMLLILDNFEQLVEEAAVLQEIIQDAPLIKLLVTSRQRLRLPEEWPVEIKGLSHPVFSQNTNFAVEEVDYKEFGAVQLFCQRAKRLFTGFKDTEENLNAIARICHLVEGFPLAVELSASAIRIHTCQDILEKLSESLDFLKTNSPSVSDRHRSLRAVFDNTWQLLNTVEREALKRLSIFRGGFEKEAAQIFEIDQYLLASLLDKSLINRDSSGRYNMHEAFREYSAQIFVNEMISFEKAKNLHALYFADFLKTRGPSYESTNWVQNLKDVSVEIANVEEGWVWLVRTNKLDAIESYIDAAFVYFQNSGQFNSGEQFFGYAMKFYGGSEFDLSQHVSLSKIVARYGIFVYQVGKIIKGIDYLRQALSQFRERELPRDTAFTLQFLGEFKRQVGEIEQAKIYLDEALSIANEIDDVRRQAGVLRNLGVLARRSYGMHDEAIKFFDEAIKLAYRVGDLTAYCNSLSDLASSMMLQTQYQKAQNLYEKAIDISKSNNLFGILVAALSSKAQLLIWTRDHEECRKTLQECLLLCKKQGYVSELARCYMHLGQLANGEKNQAEALTMYQLSLNISQPAGLDRVSAGNYSRIADIYYDRSQFEEAYNYYLKCLEKYESVGDLINIIDAKALTGMASVECFYVNEAKKYLTPVLEIDDEHKLQPIASALLSTSRLLWKSSSKVTELMKQAFICIGFIKHHPTVHIAFKDEADQLFNQIKDVLPQYQVKSLMEEGKSKTLDNMRAEAISILEQVDSELSHAALR